MVKQKWREACVVVIVRANIIIIKNKIRKMLKITFAIPALAAAIPVNPKGPAM